MRELQDKDEDEAPDETPVFVDLYRGPYVNYPVVIGTVWKKLVYKEPTRIAVL